jgi:hypothetical protein
MPPGKLEETLHETAHEVGSEALPASPLRAIDSRADLDDDPSVASSNAHLVFTFPLREDQRQTFNIFTLHFRPGLASASFPFNHRRKQEHTRFTARGTAKALRMLAAELEVELTVIQDLEDMILRKRQDRQQLNGKQVYPQLRALLDQAGRGGTTSFDCSNVQVWCDSHYAECAELPRQQWVVLRFQKLVLARCHGQDSCIAFLTDAGSIQTAEALESDRERDLKELYLAHAATVVVNPHARLRPAAFAS